MSVILRLTFYDIYPKVDVAAACSMLRVCFCQVLEQENKTLLDARAGLAASEGEKTER